MIYAKNILADKFWILYNASGGNCGTIQVNQKNQYVAYVDSKNYEFDTLTECFSTLRIKESSDTTEIQEVEDFKIESYPVHAKPFNVLFSVDIKSYIYTKNEKSKSFHAAGYFIIKFANGWTLSFCPKVTTLKEWEWHGPFTTKIEARHRISNLDF